MDDLYMGIGIGIAAFLYFAGVSLMVWVVEKHNRRNEKEGRS